MQVSKSKKLSGKYNVQINKHRHLKNVLRHSKKVFVLCHFPPLFEVETIVKCVRSSVPAVSKTTKVAGTIQRLENYFEQLVQHDPIAFSQKSIHRGSKRQIINDAEHAFMNVTRTLQNQHSFYCIEMAVTKKNQQHSNAIVLLNDFGREGIDWPHKNQ